MDTGQWICRSLGQTHRRSRSHSEADSELGHRAETTTVRDTKVISRLPAPNLNHEVRLGGRPESSERPELAPGCRGTGRLATASAAGRRDSTANGFVSRDGYRPAVAEAALRWRPGRLNIRVRIHWWIFPARSQVAFSIASCTNRPDSHGRGVLGGGR